MSCGNFATEQRVANLRKRVKRLQLMALCRSLSGAQPGAGSLDLAFRAF